MCVGHQPSTKNGVNEKTIKNIKLKKTQKNEVNDDNEKKVYITIDDKRLIQEIDACEVCSYSTSKPYSSIDLELNPGEKRGWWRLNSPAEDTSKSQAFVRGAINDQQVVVMMDTGANTSIISSYSAHKLGLKPNADKIQVSGLGSQNITCKGSVMVKLTLGFRIVYRKKLIVVDIGRREKLILGMDFMTSAGIRIDAGNSKLCLPDEVMIPLVTKKIDLTFSRDRKFPSNPFMSVENEESWHLEPKDYRVIRIPKHQGRTLWVRCHKDKLLPKVKYNKGGKPTSIIYYNISNEVIYLSHHQWLGLLIKNDSLPIFDGYVRVGSDRYRGWQSLIYEADIERFIAAREQQYAEEPEPEKPAVDIPPPITVTRILKRKVPRIERWDRSVNTEICCLELEENFQETMESYSKEETQLINNDGIIEIAELESVRNEPRRYYHSGCSPSVEDLASQLTMIPEFEYTEPAPIDISEIDFGEDENTVEEKAQMEAVLEKYKSVFVDGGNGMPPPAQGVVCDIDVGNAEPVAQRSRRVPPQYLDKLLILLKDLLKAGLIVMSESEWASPIVLVVKKNKVDIRLCIDYRMVNSLTKLKTYSMPLIDDMLDNLHAINWYCSIDAASGFWAIPMTARAQKISAFICPLGHFEWTRMAQGLKNAPQLYQRILDNAIYGYVRPGTGWESCDKFKTKQQLTNEQNQSIFDTMESMDIANNQDIFHHGIPERIGFTPILNNMRRSFIDDIMYGRETWNEVVRSTEKLLDRFKECKISLGLKKCFFGKKQVEMLSHLISSDGIEAKPKNIEVIKSLPFPNSLKSTQSFLGMLNYYSRFIENFSTMAAILYELKEDDFRQNNIEKLEKARISFELLKQAITSTPLLKHLDPAKVPIITVYANEWAIGATLCQDYDGTLFPIRYTSRILKESEIKYHPAEKEILALLRMLKVYEPSLIDKHIQVRTKYSTMGWIFKNTSETGRLLNWAILLSPWELEIIRDPESKFPLSALTAAAEVILKKSDRDETLELVDILPRIAPQRASKGCKIIEPYRWLSRTYEGYIGSFDGSIVPETKGGYGSYGAIIWKVPEWKVVVAVTGFLEKATVNEAEYKGMIAVVTEAINLGIKDITIFGDSRIAIQQTNDTIRCNKTNLQVLMNQVNKLKEQFSSIKIIHIARKYNAAADHLATIAKDAKAGGLVPIDKYDELVSINTLPNGVYEPEGINDKPSIADAEVLEVINDPADVLKLSSERRKRISKAQDEEEELFNIKQLLRNQPLPRDVYNSLKINHIRNHYGLGEDEILYYYSTPAGTQRRPFEVIRLVVPDTLKTEFLSHYHDGLQGGHQGTTRTYHRMRREVYWKNMYADIENYVKSCLDCNTSRGRPDSIGASPGNILPTRPFQVVSMDFITPLPMSGRGNSSLLMFQCMFSGYVTCKAMSSINSSDVAEAYMEKIFIPFGASDSIRHDRDPKFMSDVFRKFNRLVKQNQIATLAYRPQANGQQERSIQTVSKSIKVYIEDINQNDWDEYADALMFAINSSYDTTRRDTPFYIVYGWDPKSTLEMVSSLNIRRYSKQELREELAGPAAWRRRIYRHHQMAITTARVLQEEKKRERADRHNDGLRRTVNYEEGERVWLYIDQVKEGYSRKLAHRWHGPFRINRKIDDVTYELIIPERRFYRFHPRVHVSRLKKCHERWDRPTIPLTVNDNERFDFDEELLPEDSFLRELADDEYEVIGILDKRIKNSTRNSGRKVQYKVQWAGDYEPTWEDVDNLTCMGLIADYCRRTRQENSYAQARVAEEREQ